MTTITPGPTPPNRQDPENFAAAADAFAAWMVVMAAQANALAEEVNDMHDSAAADAATATTKAGDAAAARDIAMAAVNYKGVWANLGGALAIPASAYHSGSIWMLTESVANVAAETPGVSSKWLNVTPASGLGTAAYADEADFQPAIGALTGLLISAGGGTISAATAAQIVAAIGSVYVANATHATSASSADLATAIMDGAVSSAAKIASGIITWAKHAAMSTGKLIGRSSSGAGSPEEISLGSRLTLVDNVLNAAASDVTSVGGNTGAVTNAQVAAAATAGYGYTPVSGANHVPKDFAASGFPVGITVQGKLSSNPGGSGSIVPGSTVLGQYITSVSDPGATSPVVMPTGSTWRNVGTNNAYPPDGESQPNVAFFQRIA